MQPRARIWGTIGVVAAFSVMLVGTSKPKEDRPAEAAKIEVKSDAKSDSEVAAKAEPAKPQAVPSTDGWTESTPPDAGVTLKLPPGASIVRSGNDTSFAGRYVAVKMPSGYEVSFQQQSGAPVDLVEQKRWYRNDASGFVGFVLEASDTLIAHRNEGPPVGEYWEVTTCSAPIDGKPLCTSSAGALVDGTKVTKMTNDEVVAVVAIARSIAAK